MTDSTVILEKIQNSITASSDPKTISMLSKAWHDVRKSDSEYIKAQTERYSKEESIRLEEMKITADIDDRQTRAMLEQSKLDVDAVVRKTQVDNDKQRIDNEYAIQMYKTKVSSRDNMLMAGAAVGIVGVMYGCEKAGILLSRNAGNAFKLIRFVKPF